MLYQRLKLWTPVAIWMVVIFLFSNRPDLPSNSIDWLDFLIKKTAHVSEFAILTFLVNRAFGDKIPKRAIVFSLIYAFSDEIHQLFTPWRGAKLTDVLIDSTGITLMSLYLIKKNGNKKSK